MEIAQNITVDMGMDVFVIEKTPRYDTEDADPSGMKQKLSKYANGVLSSTTGPTPRMFLIEQSGLARTSARARSELFKPDGLHLTQKGLRMYSSNLIMALRECYGELAIPSTQHQQGMGKHDSDQRGDDRQRRRGDQTNNRTDHDGDRVGRSHRGDGHRGDHPHHHADRDRGGRYGRRGDQRYPPYPAYNNRGRGRRADNDYWDYHDDRGYSGGYRRRGKGGGDY